MFVLVDCGSVFVVVVCCWLNVSVCCFCGVLFVVAVVGLCWSIVVRCVLFVGVGRWLYSCGVVWCGCCLYVVVVW